MSRGRLFLVMISFFLQLLGLGCSDQKTQRWLVYYGNQPEILPLKDLDLAILEPDHISPHSLKQKYDCDFIAYLSLGEVHETRWYWPEIKKSGIFVEPNPNWPQAHRVDIRSQAWRDLVLHKIIPQIMEKGYQGLFFDTVDTAIYLEDTQPEKYAGSKQAMVEFIRTIKETYPELKLIPNNGLELLSEYGDVTDGVLVEDLYTSYDFQTKEYYTTPIDQTNYKMKFLDSFQMRFKKPVYNLLYEKSFQSNLSKSAQKQSLKKGYQWYVTSIDLNEVGLIRP